MDKLLPVSSNFLSEYLKVDILERIEMKKLNKDVPPTPHQNMLHTHLEIVENNLESSRKHTLRRNRSSIDSLLFGG